MRNFLGHGAWSHLRAIAISGALLPVTSYSADDQSGRDAYTFQLTKGAGTAVCDAYLMRLNETRFKDPPYCDIPEDDSIPGFSKLRRVRLKPDEVASLWGSVYWFSNWQRQVPVGEAAASEVGRNQDDRVLVAWRYEPQLSLSNDGRPEDVIIWRGPGADEGGGQSRHAAAKSWLPRNWSNTYHVSWDSYCDRMANMLMRQRPARCSDIRVAIRWSQPTPGL